MIARNWRIRDGELDIVAQKGRLVVVCEVKTRANLEFGTPAEAMNERKQYVVRRTAHHFIRENNLSWCSLRLDVASVVGSRVEVIVDAF